MKPLPFALWASLLLVLFSVLPAWRIQIFPSFEAYAAARILLFAVMAGLFWRFARGFDVDLSLGYTSPLKTGYGDPLLSLRAMACFIVLLGHGSTIIFVPVDVLRQATSSQSFWLLMPMPWAGVWIFFTLSGYLMGKGFFTGRYHFSRKGILHFYRNRLLRIAPLYYFAILTVALLVHPEVMKPANLWSLGLELLFDYEGTRGHGAIGLLWSVATEMQFYLTVPVAAFLISKATARAGVLPIAALALIFGLAYRLAAGYFAGSGGAPWVVAVYCPLLGNLDIFAFGMLTSWVVQRYPLQWPRLSYGVLMSAALYVIAAWCWTKVLADPGHFDFAMRYFAPSFFAVATAAIIFVHENAVRHPADVLSRFTVQRTQLLGILTFAIYIWHDPIFTSFAKLFPAPLTSNGSLAALALAIPAVILFSWVTWRAVEKPFDDLRQRA